MAANGSVWSNITNHESNGSDSKRFGPVTRTQSFSSIGRTSSNTGSSFRRLFGLQDGTYNQLDEDTENEIMSQAGDIGDRQLSRRASHERPSLHFSMDDGVVFPVPEGFLESYGFWSKDPSTLDTVSPVSALPSEIISPIATPLPNEPILHKKQVQEEAKQLPPSLEYIACLVYLAVFGILGVILLFYLCDLCQRKAEILTWTGSLGDQGKAEIDVCDIPQFKALILSSKTTEEAQAEFYRYLNMQVFTRYLLQKLFGPGVVGLTSDHTILYLDLPSNMVGSFLMGWFGVVFKASIARMSDPLAIGLSTGYLGSVTTFSAWNQKMLDLSIHGHWVFAVLGFAVGLFLSAYSIIFEVETAKGFKWLLSRSRLSACKGKRNNQKYHLAALLVFILIWGGLWATSVVLLKKEFKKGGSGAQLWLACLVCPFGVWMRWWLARLNGRGVGKAPLWKWIPFGTLIANVSAACTMAALGTTRLIQETGKQ